jgi:alpha-beta hydrolase superfamily lysophospholipase
LIIGAISCGENSKISGKTVDVAEKNEVVEDITKSTSREVTFTTSDGLTIYGDLHEVSLEAPIILLFHQARGSARGEYGNIIPKLMAKGYNILAIDQRNGGDYFTSRNRTVDSLSKKDYSYCDAYPDLEAALDFVINSGFTGKKLIWGSSYSAALVIQLGDRRGDDIDGVLAFSPASGGPMQACDPNPIIESIKIPLMILRPRKEMENESVKSQFELATTKGHTTFISENGVHGSSMLVEERTGAEVEETWNAVFAFIDTVLE